MLKMRHPDFPDAPVADCPSEEAFELVWKAKGWELVPSAEVADVIAAEEQAAREAAELDAVEFTGHTEDEFTKDYLVAAAGRRGTTTTGTKAEILSALQEHEAARAVV